MRVSDKPFSENQVSYLANLQGSENGSEKKLEKFFSKNLEVSNKPRNFANAFTKSESRKEKEVFEEI